MGALTVETSRRAFVLVILTILPACTQMRVTSTMPLRRPYSTSFRPPRPNILITSTDRSPLPQAMGLAEPAGDSMVVRRIERTPEIETLTEFAELSLVYWLADATNSTLELQVEFGLVAFPGLR